ncbi:MAG: hypothetical protein LPJ89_10960 [Hymenobacteraceae bacterium]|nr:hypothetical protein [Hymenobacteraceae bacterium]MDX5395488.1 hypothetical protein [Hymenobacteraceae bacterium]MDX5444288.1 hypothetical protein [Hymenobacteraceae bacterium]MDX5511540.1 hypothetical protein [Hymenobacteraceae bacterium]
MIFIRNLILFSALIGLCIWLLLHFTGYNLVHPYIWYIFGFFIFITAVTFTVTRLGIQQDEDNFQLYYFGSMGLRVLLSIGVVFVYVYVSKERELQFVLNFFVLYFLYTGFEIYSILTNLRPHLKKQHKSEI